MEPRQTSPEQLPALPAQPEVLAAPGSPEAVEAASRRNEQVERGLARRVEVAAQMPAQVPASALPAPVPVSDPQAVDDSQISSPAPLVAADEDLIEKEWVDKAKKVIADTKDDPYRREKEVSRLQIEYVRKRYGRVIGGDNAQAA